jgi:hypothetical protein
MYKFNEILYGIKNPRAAGREINRLIHTRGHTQTYNPAGSGIFSEDWDNLLILDACRYDYFHELADLPGTTSYRYSLAPATYQFIRAEFTGNKAHDTVYVSSNGWFLQLKDEIGAEVYKFIDLLSDGDSVEQSGEEMKVPSPKAVTDHALCAFRDYPNKRLIVHYLQPHHPFIGPRGKQYSDLDSSSLIKVVDASNKDDDKLRYAYKENLELVLEEVATLLEQLKGKTVVTADHGEMLGDRHDYWPSKDYGHHPGIFNDATVKVPWHVYENGNRREVISEDPGPSDPTDADLDEHLRNLGYKS